MINEKRFDRVILRFPDALNNTPACFGVTELERLPDGFDREVPMREIHFSLLGPIAGQFRLEVVQENELLRTEKATLETEKTELATQVATLTNDKSELSETILRLDVTIATLTAEKFALQTQADKANANYRTAIDLLTVDLVTASIDRDLAKNEVADIYELLGADPKIADIKKQREIAKVEAEIAEAIERKDDLVNPKAVEVSNNMESKPEVSKGIE